MATFATFQLSDLKNELVTDPAGLGYNAAGRNDTDMTTKINRRRAQFQIARTDIQGQEILEAIDITEMRSASTVIQAAWFESFTQSINPVRLLTDALANTRMLNNLLVILVNQSTSETRVKALGQRNASRAEILWGEGFNLNLDQISAALNLP